MVVDGWINGKWRRLELRIIDSHESFRGRNGHGSMIALVYFVGFIVQHNNRYLSYSELCFPCLEGILDALENF